LNLDRASALAAVALLLTACGGAQTTVAPPSASSKTIIDSFGRPWWRIDNDGTYLVGVDVPAGDYRNGGGTMCEWSRLGSSYPADVIAGNTSSSPQVIRIQLSDIAFTTHNCGSWQMFPGL
jgi:hypothetical protein